MFVDAGINADQMVFFLSVCFSGSTKTTATSQLTRNYDYKSHDEVYIYFKALN